MSIFLPIHSIYRYLVLVLALGFSSCSFEQASIDEPHVGDIYVVECNYVGEINVAYQYMKIKAITGESITFYPNRVYYPEQVYCMVPADYFSSVSSFSKSKQEIRHMYDKGEIIEIIRSYENSCLGKEK